MEKPTPPMDGECCESECSPCVWDTYYEEMNAWRQAEAERKAAEAAAGDNAGQQS
ncbi:oxidoreductase-like domain-containing protein [Marinobacterium lutimaris]|uniref:oxidoreductase-like domain-containing protein n=1 Tax=Marinobacterium lutimaris TaxID=568106 RepID=UPI000CDE9464|nr:oxidoreductase-like domain-containing protein [Marinobacterium lutimaris]